MTDELPDSIHVLLVEDSVHDQIALQRAFDRSAIPFRLTVRQRAEEIHPALQTGSSTYDIVVVDYDLPGINGLQAYERLRDRPTLPPFVMLTGAGSEDIAVKALKAGMADYLVKDPGEGYLNLLPLKLEAVRRQHRDRLARHKAQTELKKAHDKLEELVAERTADLKRTVQTLRGEITEREKSEQALRRSEEALRRLSMKIVDMQECERRKIAKELHDSIGSSLAAIKFAVEGKLETMQGESPDDIISLEEIFEIIRETIKEVRRISTNLRPSLLDERGLIPAMTALFKTNRTVYRDIRFDCRLDVEEEEIDDPAKIVIYRITQEALNNALRHSGADAITVALETSVRGDIALCVADNGRGMDPGRLRRDTRRDSSTAGGLGLQAMHDRAELIGAALAIDASPGKGTRVCLTLPAGSPGKK